MTWYGQKETDRKISEVLNKYWNKHDGYCVEVGVSDGKKGSNTLHFEEMGWDVLCIDPILEHVEEARKIRKTVYLGACGNRKQTLPFYIFDIGENNILSSLSGLKPDPKLLVSHGHLINKCYTIDVEVESLDDILVAHDAPREIGFISIDTEGTELDVLQGLDLSGRPWEIKMLVVENNHDDPEIERYLHTFGWIKEQRYFVNDIYINGDLV